MRQALSLIISISFALQAPTTVWASANQLTPKQILQASSSGALSAESGRIIIDNDAAFMSKIQAIRSAKAGEVIRLAYFIYSDDYTSSLFSKELILAAQRGVKINMLLDATMAVGKYDLFNTLEESGRGNIEVRFFGMPSELLWRDIVFLSRPCSRVEKPTAKECSNYKESQVDQWGRDFFAELLMSSLFSKNAAGIKTSVVYGQLIDLGQLSEGPVDPEQKGQLRELLRLLIAAKIKKDKRAALKLMVAMSLYGEEINPVLNEIYGRLPIENMVRTSLKEWEHLTDYLHHKILLVGERFAQLGGRNIEDSYHMKSNEFSKKYTFMDTDMALNLSGGGREIAKAYDELFNFKERVQSLQSMKRWFQSDFIANPEALSLTLKQCGADSVKTESQREVLATCLQSQISSQPGFKSAEQRRFEILGSMEAKAQTLQEKYLSQVRLTETWKASARFDDSISAEDIRQSLFSYIENLPYNRALSESRRTRTYGVTNGKELMSGKGIHDLWVRGLESACASSEKKPTRVIIHSAYLLPSSNLMRAFAKMIDGTWDCRNVHMTFLTNSIETTDLNPINIAAQYQLISLFNIYAQREKFFSSAAKERSARLDYFEYQQRKGNSTLSLHTKVSVMGDSLIVGSANSDVRSYYMDTNNGFFLNEAKQTAREYTSYLESLLQDAKLTRERTQEFSQKSLQSAQNEVEQIILDILNKYKFGRELSSERKADIVAKVQRLGLEIYQLSQGIFSAQLIDGAEGEDGILDDLKRKDQQMKLEQNFNRLLQVL